MTNVRCFKASYFNSVMLFLLTGLLIQPAYSATTIRDAFAEGGFYANFRYRYEHVDDDLAAKDANASTLRSVLGYQSGNYYGFSFLLEGEQISRIFSGDFFEGFGTANTDTATVADPDGTELNQGYLSYQAPANNNLKLGRQIITYRDAPFHRFIGTILWRQNWQTFDAVSLQNTFLPDVRGNYAYVWNVNRIFGDDAPAPLSNFDSDSHFVNVQYTRFAPANIEGYGYLLDFDNAPAFSSKTFGIRIHGGYPLFPAVTPIYALEYAHQFDHANNPNDFDVSYQLAEAGLEVKPIAFVDSLMIKGSFERLSGNGTNAFQTPLGTNHAFQGTADRFLVTPGDGIRDYYVSSVATAFGFKLIAAYHVFDSDKFDYRYGEEFDIELFRDIGKHFTLGVKYADFNADENTNNLVRNGVSTVSADAQKIWVYAMAKF